MRRMKPFLFLLLLGQTPDGTLFFNIKSCVYRLNSETGTKHSPGYTNRNGNDWKSGRI